jgi:hypothetical protein
MDCTDRSRRRGSRRLPSRPRKRFGRTCKTIWPNLPAHLADNRRKPGRTGPPRRFRRRELALMPCSVNISSRSPYDVTGPGGHRANMRPPANHITWRIGGGLRGECGWPCCDMHEVAVAPNIGHRHRYRCRLCTSVLEFEPEVSQPSWTECPHCGQACRFERRARYSLTLCARINEG